MFFGAKEGTLTIPGKTVDYITFGRGEKPLVMIQGLNTRGIRGMAIPLAFMYRLFARDYRVYFFDRRRELGEAVTVRELAGDVAAAMDALGIANADVLGVSQGGMMGQYLAIDRPDLVRKLVLAVTLSRNNELVVDTIRRWVELTEQGRFRDLTADMAEKMYSDAYLRRYRFMLPLLAMVQKPRDTGRFITLAKACLTCEAYGELDKIRCPVLVLGGERDRIVGAEASRELAEKLGCGLHLYPGLGHALYEEAGDFNRRVYDFLKEAP